MPRGALNTAGPKNQDPRPYAQTARDKDGVPTTASQVLCRRSRGPRSKAQETSYFACVSPATTAASLSSIWFQPSN